MYDLFISHSSGDKAQYITPLVQALDTAGVTYWLDEVDWGDGLALKISEGLRKSRFVLLCLSRNFMRSPWAQVEMNAVLSIQSSSGKKRVLPLILDSKAEVLEAYPLIAGLAYQDLAKVSHEQIAKLVSELSRKDSTREEVLTLHVEGKNTGRVYDFSVPSTCTIKYLLHKIRQTQDLREELDTGAFERFRIRWVLVEKRSVQTWNEFPRAHQEEAYLVRCGPEDRPSVSLSDLDRVGDFVNANDSFFLIPVQDTSSRASGDTLPAGTFH